MKVTTNKKVKNNRQRILFNVPLQVMVSKKLDSQIDKRIEQLSKSKAEYIRGLIVEDVNNLNSNGHI